MNKQERRQAFESYKREKSNTEGFFDVLERFRESKDMKACDLYQKAGITKAYYYKLRGSKHPNIAKERVVAFGLALKLNRQEMDELLLSAGFALSAHSKFDLAVMFCLDHHLYDIDEIQDLIPEQDRKGVYTRKAGTEEDEEDDREEYPENDPDLGGMGGFASILNYLAEGLEDFNESLGDAEEDEEDREENPEEELDESEGTEEDEAVKAAILPIVKILNDLADRFDETTPKMMGL